MKKIALLIIAFFIVVNSYSQEEPKPRKKIGLVLSGGGAKGFAHIGVLKVIEEAGLKIDYIGGTSMGAIIGGLYASGLNAHQIDSIFKATNFNEIVYDFMPRSSKNFYDKRNDDLYALVLPFDNFKIGIPEAISKGIDTYNLVSRITRNVWHIKDFNKLPTPFLCIGTNIETGEEVLLNKGNLAQSMMASAAFPSLYPPVEIDGKLLIDGGVVNNYPIEEVRKLGADIIIGVDVQDDLSDRKSLKDATKILVQIIKLQSIEKNKKNSLETDVYIKPDIKDYGVISFDKGQEIIEKGEEAAFAVFEKIKALTDESNLYHKPKLKLQSDSLQINNINSNELNNFTRDYILGKLRFKPGAKITFSDLKIGVNNINSTRNFSSINYSLESNEAAVDLNINLVENPTKTYLKFGLHFDGLYKSAVLVNLTHKTTFFKNDVVSADIILGDNFRYNFDYYVDNGFNLRLGFKSRFNQFNRNVTNDLTNINLESVNTVNVDFYDLTNQIYFQSLLYNKFLIGAGAELKFLKIKSETLTNATTMFDKSNYVSAYGYFKYDTFNNKFFPSKGSYFFGDFQSYLLSSNYTNVFKPFSIAKVDMGIAEKVFNKTTLILQTEAGFSLGNDGLPFFDFVLGGYGANTINNFRSFYGYDFLSISGNSFIKGTATIDYEFLKKNHLNFSANFANLGFDIFQAVDRISIPKYSGYALGYGIETVVGPVELKYSWSPEMTKGYVWVSAGFWF